MINKVGGKGESFIITCVRLVKLVTLKGEKWLVNSGKTHHPFLGILLVAQNINRDQIGEKKPRPRLKTTSASPTLRSMFEKGVKEGDHCSPPVLKRRLI